MKNLNIAWKQEKNLDDDDSWLCAACPVLDRGAGPGTGQNHNPRPFLAPAKIHKSTGAPAKNHAFTRGTAGDFTKELGKFSKKMKHI